jgi:hypothetical protein
MPMIELLVGPIASGKSTYARKRAREGALIVEHDRMCAMLHCDPGGKGYEDGLRECYRRMEESIAWATLAAGRDVVIDRTHLTAESRRRWIEWASYYDALNTFEDQGPVTPVVAVVFPDEGPHVHACRRHQADARGRTFDEWLMVARHHAEQARAEPIDISEGFAEIRYIKRMEGF